MFSGRSCGSSLTRSCPFKRMLPEVGVSKPASMRSSVDLPQPLEPSKAKISPWAISRLTWSTARKTAPPALAPKSLTTS